MPSSFSIIIPVKELNTFLKESLPVLFSLEGPTFEIMVLPNFYFDAPVGQVVPVEVLKQDPYFLALDHFFLGLPFLKVIPTGVVGPAQKRDLGAHFSTCDILAFLDDDAYPKADWLVEAAKYFDHGVDAIGGPAVTPETVGLLEAASGLVFETFLGGGTTRFRYRAVREVFETDDFPTVNFLVRKKIFTTLGGFDNEFWPGEDTKFCLDFVKAGYKILYTPTVQVWHHRRPLFRPHLKQISAYGRHRGFFVKRFPETSLRLNYFVPSFFLLSVLLGWIPGLFFPPWLIVYFLGIFSFLFFGLLNAFLISGRPALSLLTTVGIFLTHLYYGWNFIRGLTARQFRSKLR
jgi:cellulose synthase/poly-beta-1,6-N-acetylglucosamine synthase-like glycosyltransferase